MENKQAIIDLGIDLARGKVTNFSLDESNEILRKALNDLTGSEDGKCSPRAFRRNKNQVFEILEETLETRVEEGIKNQFEPFVDYRNVAFGDAIQFNVPVKQWFRVDSIAGGTNNLRRQRIGQDQSFTIGTGWDGVKIYEELERFLAGRVDWVSLINDVETSFVNKTKEDIHVAIKSAYNAVTAPYKESGTWDLEKFNIIVEHIRAATGLDPMVIGTRVAVSKALPNSNYISDRMKDERNNTGFFETVEGTKFGIIPQFHKIGTTTFGMDEDFLLILPNGNEKLVKHVTEGETQIKEVSGQSNADDSQEYVVRRKTGTAAVSSDVFGAWIFD